MISKNIRQLAHVGYFGLLALLALLPFHAFFTTWLGTSLGKRALIQSWKEILILLLAGICAYLVVSQRPLRKRIFGWWVNWLIGIYAALHLLLAAIWPAQTEALLFGLRTNLAFLLVFIVAQIIGYYQDPKQLTQTLTKILFAAGVVVGFFGLLQMFVLPNDFLRHFGYGPETIQPFLTISQQGGPVRILATLGGPNQLGQYLIIPLSVAMAQFVKSPRWWLAALSLPMLVTLYGSHSRSAWVGLLVAVLIIIFLKLGSRARVIAAGAIAGLAVALALVIVPLRNSTFVSQVLLHAPGAGVNSSSDTERVSAIRQSAQAIIERPFGHGPGTAGPAALRNPNAGIVAENYYLQLGVEIGVIGLVLFVAILAGVAISLWSQVASSSLATALFASFAGIGVVNLVLHGWADSTTALLWWASAGAMIGKK